MNRTETVQGCNISLSIKVKIRVKIRVRARVGVVYTLSPREVLYEVKASRLAQA